MAPSPAAARRCSGWLRRQRRCPAGPASMHYSPRRPRVRCGQHRQPHEVRHLPGLMLPPPGRPATSAQTAPRRGTFRRARRRRLPATTIRTAVRCFRRRRRRWLSSAHPTGTLSPSTPSSPAPRWPLRAWLSSLRPPRRPMRCIGSVRLFRCGSAAADRPPCRPHTCVSAAATRLLWRRQRRRCQSAGRGRRRRRWLRALPVDRPRARGRLPQPRLRHGRGRRSADGGGGHTYRGQTSRHHPRLPVGVFLARSGPLGGVRAAYRRHRGGRGVLTCCAGDVRRCRQRRRRWPRARSHPMGQVGL